MDYQKELKRMQEGGSYWKPKAGKFKVKALSEIEDTEPFVKKKKDESGKEITESNEQFKLSILIDNEEKLWTFGKGKTPASTQFQLVELATNNNNKLKDLEFTVIVKTDGNKNDYTIVS